MGVTILVNDTCFTKFKSDINNISLPEKFTYPFYYIPHPLAKIAMEELKTEIKENSSWNHNFGFKENTKNPPIGKMFGVLVVQDSKGNLGYLKAISGTLFSPKTPKGFVPLLFDKNHKHSFIETGKTEVDKINSLLTDIEQAPAYHEAKKSLEKFRESSQLKITHFKLKLKQNKLERKIKRESQTLCEERKNELIKQSLKDKFELNTLKQNLKVKENRFESNYLQYRNQEIELINKRKEILNNIQEQTLRSYHFLNIKGESEDLLSLFNLYASYNPPAGSGDCAAPKLLQYAFSNNLKPIALCEFWWGAPHKLEIRRHESIYPACSSRCKPILKHMLKHMLLDDDPINVEPDPSLKEKILYEDEYMLALNKPAGLLTVPGSIVKDSLFTRIAKQFPKSQENLIVHRLDQETSGIVLMAKTKEANKEIQKQFIKRTIHKKYIALLSEVIDEIEGEIALPLTLDIHNRPRQMVSFNDGKKSRTKYKVLEKRSSTTLIEFSPITGRTHQLRVHAAHQLGLNAPIVGDTIYGQQSSRLHLHAQKIDFIHPITKIKMSIQSAITF